MPEKKEWQKFPLPKKTSVVSLMKAINVSEPLATLLLQRGINDYDQAKHFFRDSLAHLHDPFFMLGMEKAVERLNKAIENKEKILLYGDYDVDGTTAVALLYIFFRDRHPYLAYYIPDRQAEGYGLSEEGIAYALAHDFKLIITLDCGIQAVELIKTTEAKGIDFIVCDHHIPTHELPPAFAILNPKQLHCPYPYKELSGCGLGFKLLQAYCLRHHIANEILFSLLDLVAISTACDIVPITGENRILVKSGLARINAAPSVGIQALIAVSGLSNCPIDVRNLVFGLGPRINATGRLAHAKESVELLTTINAETAAMCSKAIDEKNEQRRAEESIIVAEALEEITKKALEKNYTTVVYRSHWHKGIIGIVAARCIEHYYRPTIIFTRSKGKLTGSARSVVGYDIYAAINQCSHLLLQFGGHKYAAGITLDEVHFPAFQQAFEKVVAQTITSQQRIPKININATITLDQINDKFYNIIEQMAPFGPMNMRPIFVSENVGIKSFRVLKEKHIKCRVEQTAHTNTFDLLLFNGLNFLPLISGKELLNICYSIERNNFRGKTSLQLMGRDVKAYN